MVCSRTNAISRFNTRININIFGLPFKTSFSPCIRNHNIHGSNTKYFICQTPMNKASFIPRNLPNHNHSFHQKYHISFNPKSYSLSNISDWLTKMKEKTTSRSKTTTLDDKDNANNNRNADMIEYNEKKITKQKKNFNSKEYQKTKSHKMKTASFSNKKKVFNQKNKGMMEKNRMLNLLIPRIPKINHNKRIRFLRNVPGYNTIYEGEVVPKLVRPKKDLKGSVKFRNWKTLSQALLNTPSGRKGLMPLRKELDFIWPRARKAVKVHGRWHQVARKLGLKPHRQPPLYIPYLDKTEQFEFVKDQISKYNKFREHQKQLKEKPKIKQ